MNMHIKNFTVKKFLFVFAVIVMTSRVYASCFCSPKNGYKCACEHNDLIPDSQWSWHGDSQDGFLGDFACSPSENRWQVASNKDLGGTFGWKCLYIKCN